MLLRTELEMRDAGGIVGSALVEQPLPDFTLVAGDAMHLGETGEIGLCARSGERLRCFPTRLNPRVFETALQSAAGKPLPMTLATGGSSGAVRTVDYRRQTVIAAHAPVGALGLGMVLKMDTAEIYAPVRDRILLGAALLAALVIAGTLLLRSRVRPLVERLVRAEDAARESAERLRAIADNMPALVAYLDDAIRFRFVNATYEKWFGLRPEQMIGRTMREVWGEERYRRMGPRAERALAGETVSFDTTIRGDGGERHVRGNYIPDRDASGRVRGMYVLVSDVTPLVEVQHNLDSARQRLATRARGLGRRAVGYRPADARGGAERALGGDDRRGARRDAHHGRGPDGAGASATICGTRVDNSLRALSGEISEYAVEHRVRTRDGGWIWILSRGKVVERDPASGRALRMAGTNIDITARKLAEQRMEQLAHYDSLTGAANRALFERPPRQARWRACAAGAPRVALLYLDIDRFKPVNDRLGHAAGDALLKEFVARVRACVRETDTVGRLGGDEFAVLLEDAEATTGRRLAGGARRSSRRCARRVTAETAVVVTTSIGIAILRDASTEDADALAKRADAALYEAKAAGRNTFRVANAAAFERNG